MHNKLLNIQALRGIAAFAVMLAHLGSLGGLVSGLPTFRASVGVFGVDVFFVISGFIMYHVTGRSWGRPIPFMASRAWRIYPLWWVCLIIEVPWILRYLLGRLDEYFAYIARSFFLIPALSPSNELYPPLVPGWTLIYEMAFYLVFAGIMLSARKNVAVKLAAVFSLAYIAGVTMPLDAALRAMLTNPIYAEFIYGVLIGEAVSRGLLDKRMLSLLCVIAGFVIVLQHNVDMGPSGTGWPMRFLAFGLPAAAIVSLGIWLEGLGCVPPRWLVFLGDASYSLYLTHDLMLNKAPAMFAHVGIHLSGWGGLLALALVTIAVALTVHFFFEKPLWHLPRLLSSRKRAKPEAVANC